MFNSLKIKISNYYHCRKIIKLIRSKHGNVTGKIFYCNKGRLEIGNNAIINGNGIDNLCYSKIDIRNNASLTIGDNFGMSQTSIVCKKQIHIGNNVNIGAGTLVIDSNFHNTNWKVRRDRIEDFNTAENSPVFIDDDVFIGARCIICKGVHIGARSIIAAGSVVIKDLPPDCIAGGNPCKELKRIKKTE